MKRLFLSAGLAIASTAEISADAGQIVAGANKVEFRSTVIFALAGNVGIPNRGPLSATEDSFFSARGIAFERASQFDFASLQTYVQEAVYTGEESQQHIPVFEGPRIIDLLSSVHAEGKTLVIHRLNGDPVTVPLAEAIKEGAVLAIRCNKIPFAIGDSGPVAVIFPDRLPAHDHTNHAALGDAFIGSVFLIEIR